MEELLSIRRANAMTAERDRRLSEAIEQEQPRLRNFIRKRVPDVGDAEDILQEVFFELVEAYRLMKPVEQVTAWLFRVARNRIIDLFRRRQRDAARTGLSPAPAEGDSLELEQMLPSREAGPEAAYFRAALAEELDGALDELPEEQREVFIANELMGYTFQEIAKRTGVSVNTLLSRKRYAVQHLRRRLETIYDEFTG